MSRAVQGKEDEDLALRRERILNAAFSAFMKEGYAEASTLEIATRARVSKRALYELVGTKQELLAACISERARRFRTAETPTLTDRDGLARALTAYGAKLMREVSDPNVVAVFRLAIAEAVAAPEAARALESIGRDARRNGLREIMTQAELAGLVRGDPAEMAEQFFALLWGDLHISLLLRVAERPTEAECTRRAHAAATNFMRLYPS
ncbi:MAG: TetR/AcrR family transcriptional regulator [Candidatus Aquilonibacter sp.]